MKLLIVEDEPKTAAYLKKGLEENGFVADIAADGETGAYMARQGGYELVILDVMLPGQDGWSVLRERNCSPPFVQSFLDTVTAGSIHDGAWTEQPLSPFPAMT